MADTIDWLQSYVGETVIAEIGEGFTVFGRLAAVGPGHLDFADCDLHNQHEANSSRDVYALESQELGIRANRRHLGVPRGRLIAISRIDDLIP